MSTTLIYCEKCGHMGFSFLWDYGNNGCFSCRTKGTTKFVPQEYLDGTGNTIKDNLKEEFITKFIKSSINFDQNAWNERNSFNEQRKHQDEMLKFEIEEQSHKPKCITCGSANIKKISVTSKAGSVALWGIFSQKAKKTWHCNNCSYEW